MVDTRHDLDISVTATEYSAVSWQTHWGWENYINYNLDAQSGNTTQLIEHHIPRNARVRIVNGSLIGSAHDGNLRHFSGTSVSASAIEYETPAAGGEAVVTSAGESSKAFILDFGGIRKVKALAVAEVDGKLPPIVMVLPWMGIEFGSKPLFPYNEKLTLADPGVDNVSFTAVETAKLFIQFENPVINPPGEEMDRTDEVLDKLFIISSTLPLNTRVAVGNRPPFHTYAGELKEETPLPEFSDELNAYLDEIRAAGAEDVENFPLMITMDAPGKIALGDFQLVYDREGKAKWGDSHRQSISFDRQGVQHLPLKFPASTPNSWQIHRISLDVIPEFPDWRSFPRNTLDVPDKISASVCSDLNIAQCLSITETTELYGLGLFVSANKEKSAILIEIQTDKQGQPDNIPIVEESVTFAANDDAGWVDVMFSKPLSVVAGKNLWFVIKSKKGRLSVVLDSDSTEKAVLFNRNSAGYKKFPYNSGNLAISFRQYRKPAVGENARVVSLTIAGTTVDADLPEEMNTLTFSYLDAETGVSKGPVVAPENNSVGLDLQITAHASGSITFQNVIARYQQEMAY
ncbi:hypothetical protein [Desulfobacula sp.]|uniref:hypothetical protein n=1 Tax=Desulfobacula sp. TaxID=2593537 RepID=UPI00260221C6|nr:hypothetical protein [Desulfobacula sp.]